jgi:hypothetical protein
MFFLKITGEVGPNIQGIMLNSSLVRESFFRMQGPVRMRSFSLSPCWRELHARVRREPQ